MTHNAKTCIERPRKIGAKYTGKDLGRDEVIEQVKLDYEGKRDRWNGYNPNDYKTVIEEWEILENERQRRKADADKEKMQRKIERKLHRLAQKEQGVDISESSSDSDSDAEKDPDADGAPQVEVVDKDPRVKTAIRNLR